MPFLQEFLHYSVGLIIAAFVLYQICPQEYLSSFYLDSMAWATAYIAFAAYSHTVQHENPTMCTWMKMPVHYAHHEGNMWRHNFGIGVDWWDRVFGTYKEFDWCTPEVLENAKHDRLDISWFYMKKGGKRI